jgi:hypothetical protein
VTLTSLVESEAGALASGTLRQFHNRMTEKQRAGTKTLPSYIEMLGSVASTTIGGSHMVKAVARGLCTTDSLGGSRVVQLKLNLYFFSAS